jgi:hypothetical protein
VVNSREAGRLDVDYQGQVTNFAINYLKECVERMEVTGKLCPKVLTKHGDLLCFVQALNNNQSEPAVYHALVWALAKYDNTENEDELGGFLQSQVRSPRGEVLRSLEVTL